MSKQPKGLAAARARRLAESRAERQVLALERIAAALEQLVLVPMPCPAAAVAIKVPR